MAMVAFCIVPIGLLLLAHHHRGGALFWTWYVLSFLMAAIWGGIVITDMLSPLP